GQVVKSFVYVCRPNNKNTYNNHCMEQGRSTPLRLSGKSNKLVPRDISEGLGKLPPQARDLEEAVLGALMLEKNALNAVVEFLKPEHFYTDAHREIYQAIIDLFKDSEPVDMRTVVNQLRKNGKLELVGGAYAIADLTAKVSSAANIEYHARVIIEMAIKRELIRIASQIDRKSTRLNSSHVKISYAVFCLKKKT